MDKDMILNQLIEKISTVKGVLAIGISGSKFPLPEAGEGDIDLFIYCDRIPDITVRQDILNELEGRLEGSRAGVFAGGRWGSGDFTLIDRVETWMMYFTTDETIKEIDAILGGEYPDKLDNYFYPTGRCAMLKNMSILFERSPFLSNMKKKLSLYIRGNWKTF